VGLSRCQFSGSAGQCPSGGRRGCTLRRGVGIGQGGGEGRVCGNGGLIGAGGDVQGEGVEAVADVGYHGALRPAAGGVVVLVDAGGDGDPAPLVALLVLDAEADVGGGRLYVSLDTHRFGVEDGDVG
jgi:hypothetical protein